VTNINDDGAGSLRLALTNANTTAGADTINFNINGGGVQTIALATPLPIITEAVTIDGTTQPGYAGVPVVAINGTSLALASNGLFFSSTTGSVVRGVTIQNFKVAGIRIDGGSNNVVQASLIGLTANGTAAANNGIGVQITGGSTGNTIGGTSAAERNVIAGNTKVGLRIDGAASGNTVVGNYIGTSLNGTTAVANGSHGIEIVGGATTNQIGGTVAGSGNIVAGNVAIGIRLADAATAGNRIEGNRIGVNVAGTGLGNGLDGVRFETAAGSAPAGGLLVANANLVKRNTIAANAGNGIAVRDTSRLARIEENAISSNGQLGIVVDATANDGFPAPNVTKAVTTATGLTVSGTLAGRANESYRVELFGNAAADPSGVGEGQTFLGAVTVVTDGVGQASFALDVGTTAVVTGTSQRVLTGDTSAFSNALAKSNPDPTVQYNSRFAAGAGSTSPTVRVYDPLGTLAYEIQAFDGSFAGGVRVAMGDVNGDGANDVIVGSGPGIATEVKIYDGKTQQIIRSINPFEASFTGGVFVAAGDLDGDGKAEFVISPDEGGGPRVRVFKFELSPSVADFFAIEDPNFRGGVRTAIGDLSGDGKADLVVAAGFGGGPRIAAFSGPTIAGSGGVKLFGDFFAFEETLRNGTYVAVGDVNNDGYGELIAGGGPGGGPRVKALSGKDLTQSNGKQTAIADYFAGNAENRGGIRIASRLVTGDNLADIITGDGPGGAGVVNVFAGSALTANSFTPTVSVTPFGAIAGGVFVG
jgi:hypothetical protein